MIMIDRKLGQKLINLEEFIIFEKIILAFPNFNLVNSKIGFVFREAQLSMHQTQFRLSKFYFESIKPQCGMNQL